MCVTPCIYTNNYELTITEDMGIVILIWGSFIPSVHYGFAPDRRLIRLYWTMVRTIHLMPLCQ